MWHAHLEGEDALVISPRVTDCVVHRVDVAGPDGGVGRCGAASIQVFILCRTHTDLLTVTYNVPRDHHGPTDRQLFTQIY